MRIPRSLFLLPFIALPAFSQTWTTSVVTEARVVEDSNVFLQDQAPLVAGQTVRGEPVRADDEEFVLGFGLKAGWRAAAGETGPKVDLAYTGEWHRFSEHTSESHCDHRGTIGLKWPVGEWVNESKLSVLEVDGSHQSPVYNEVGGVPAMAGEPVRSRRAQTVTTFAASSLWQPNDQPWRARTHASVLAQDFKTDRTLEPWGCANYVDRGQGLVGIDGGRAIGGQATAWLSLRVGQQWQSNLLGRTENFSNRILRPLVGFEGAVRPTVRITTWAGPSFHHFTSERRAGTERSRTIPFFETTAAWSASKVDTLTAAARHQLWPGSGGRSVYRELKADASWSHRFDTQLETLVRAGLLHGNFFGFAASPRNDNVFNLGSSLVRPFAHGFKGELGVNREWTQTKVPQTEGRAYHRWLTSVSVARNW